MQYPKLFIIVLCLIASNAQAQTLRLGLQAGINAGAPMPKKIDKNAKGTPGINMTIGICAQKKLNTHHHLQAALLYEQKSASYFSPVQYDYIVVSGDSIDHFSGNVDGTFKNHYLTLPIDLQHQLHKKLHLTTGIYLAYLLKGSNTGTIKDGVAGFGGAFHIDNQAFNESKNLHHLDAGIRLGIAYALTTHLSLQWQTSYGITSLTKPTDNFKDKTHNLYTHLTAIYFF